MKISVCSNRPILSPCGLENLDYQVDPYIGCEHFCYYCYALDRAETDWTEEILIHEDITGQLRRELGKIPPQTIYLGYKTDPYQPCEAECCQTRKVLELFLEKGFSASILTKSDLIVRDIDLLKAMDGSAVSISVAFNDENIRKQFEANTVSTEVRIDALCRFRKAGIRTGALICPVIPYLTDVKALVDMLASDADVIWIYGLSIVDRSDQNWLNIQGILNNQFPHLKDRIEAVLFSKDHMYWAQLREDLVKLKKDRQLNLNIHL